MSGLSNHIRDVNSVLMPLIRNVMPAVIAQDIVGVQPMTAPTTAVFKMRKRFGTKIKKFPGPPRYKMSKEKLKNFLRVNDRRKTHTLDEMRSYNYPSVKVEYNMIWKLSDEWEEWLDTNMPNHYFYAGGADIFFSEEQYKVMYLLRWS